jgi:hypothetical protein
MPASRTRIEYLVVTKLQNSGALDAAFHIGAMGTRMLWVAISLVITSENAISGVSCLSKCVSGVLWAGIKPS